jgi:hypothetical protein
MCESAYKLALKYGNKDWIKKYARRLKKTVGEESFLRISEVAKNYQPLKVSFKNRNIPDFERGMYFAKNRW